jgi:hypothetical protein
MTHRRFIVEKAEIGLIGLAVMGSNLALVDPLPIFQRARIGRIDGSKPFKVNAR